MNAEINRRCPDVATKKDSHIWTPTKKARPPCHGVHVLQRQLQAAHMERVEVGAMATGMGQ